MHLQVHSSSDSACAGPSSPLALSDGHLLLDVEQKGHLSQGALFNSLWSGRAMCLHILHYM